MTKLKIKENIEEEETKKVKYLILGIVVIFAAWILINIFLPVTLSGKVISGIVMLLLVLYLGFEWYRAYYL